MKIILSSRRHHYAARLSIFLVTMVLITGMAGCCQPPPSEIVEIHNWYDLDDVRDNLEGNYILMEDLTGTTDGYNELVGDTVDKKGWKPIGTEGDAFKGEFDGNGRTISDLFIDRPHEDEVGLFGRVQEGVIENLGLENVNVTGKKYVGALVGYSWKGTLDSDDRPPGSKTYSRGIVTGEENVGGLVGNNYDGTVNQCESNVEIFLAASTPDEARYRTGGLVGLNSGTVLHCNYNGVVNGDRQVGGLVGLNEHLVTIVGHVEDCGGVYSVNGNLEVGGVAGRNTGDIRRSSFKGDVNGIMIGDGVVVLNEGATVNAYSSDTEIPGSYIGGVVGVNEGTVEDCSAEATVEGYQYVGGLAGANEGTLDNCASSGDVTGDSDTGRLVGYNTGTVSNSESTSCVTGIIDCGPLVGRNEGVISGVDYNLQMAVAPVGAGTATDMSGGSPYAAGVTVSIKAVAAVGYQFVSWIAPAGTFANANAATTTFTMPSQDVTITANFVGSLDHATCYWVEDEAAPYIGEVVYLEDEFGAVNAMVEWATAFCNPVEKLHNDVLTPVSNPNHHLAVYYISYEEEPKVRFVEVNNQFGTQQLTVWGPVALAVPTQKLEPWYHEPPVGLDHYLLYEVIEGSSVEVVVGLNDEFEDQPDVWVYEPILFANPVRKTHGDEVNEIINPEVHGVMYYIEGDYVEMEVQVVNQFGGQILSCVGPFALAVPSEKMSPYPALPPAQ